MSTFALIFFIIIISLSMISISCYVGSTRITSINTPASTTTTTTTIRRTTTTAATTTSTQPSKNFSISNFSISNFSAANFLASNVTDENIAWLERRTFDLVNLERTKRGLHALNWNDAIALVAKAHSKDMSDNNFFSHNGSDGSNESTRLTRGGVSYWNISAENLLMESGISYYLIGAFGNIVETDYNTFEEMAQNATQGWMNSTGHRENILNPELDESGMGVYAFNDSFYFTQDFITRAYCGYKGGVCCETAGYLPWCYVPWTCTEGVCG